MSQVLLSTVILILYPSLKNMPLLQFFNTSEKSNFHFAKLNQNWKKIHTKRKADRQTLDGFVIKTGYILYRTSSEHSLGNY